LFFFISVRRSLDFGRSTLSILCGLGFQSPFSCKVSWTPAFGFLLLFFSSSAAGRRLCGVGFRVSKFVFSPPFGSIFSLSYFGLIPLFLGGPRFPSALNNRGGPP